MRIATITITAVFDDAVTDEMIDTIACNAHVQVEEPVVGWDDSGNEIELDWESYGAVRTRVETEAVDVADGVTAAKHAVDLRMAGHES